MQSNSPRSRDYFITINQGAKSYDEALEIVKSLNTKLYAAIYHDKDILQEKDENGVITEKPKKKHLHIVLELKNPTSFNSIQNKFEGAHIETPRYKKSAYQYLIHNSPRSKEKYQYSPDEIISNDLKAVKFYIESEDYEIFKENMWLRYIYKESDIKNANNEETIKNILLTNFIEKMLRMKINKEFIMSYCVSVLTKKNIEPEHIEDIKNEIKEKVAKYKYN